MDWWVPLGEAGHVGVHEPLAPDEVQARLASGSEISLGLAELAGHALEFVARGRTRLVRTAGETVAVLDLSAPPDLTGAFHRPVDLLGESGEAILEHHGDRGSRLRGALRYLRIAVGERAWAWHYAGGRAAGERLVLVPGGQPGHEPPRVITHPSARGRSLGNPTGGAGADVHVTSWTADAAPAEVVLVELLATTWLGGVVDYRAARIAGGLSELLTTAPRPDANTT